MNWEITPQLFVPMSEFELSYARSSGPGGQNVNKVNSKAVLRWNVLANQSLPLGVRGRLLGVLRSRLSAEGSLVLMSDRFRDQLRNREDCFEKLRELILAAAVPPTPRKETKPSKGSRRRLKEGKSRHSEKKKLRRMPPGRE